MLVIPEGTHGLACHPHTAPGTPGKIFSKLQHGKWKWSTTKSLKVIDDRHNVWKWKWLMWASTRTAQLLVKEVTIEPYTLIQCMIYTHFCIFGLWPWSPAWLPCIAYLGDGLAYLDDGHVPLHDGQGHLPLLLGVLLHRRVHDQKTTYDYVVVKILETGEKADNKTSRHLILSQGR